MVENINFVNINDNNPVVSCNIITVITLAVTIDNCQSMCVLFSERKAGCEENGGRTRVFMMC